MTAYRVRFHTGASLTITVEVDDTGMGSEEAREAAIERAYEELPGDLCAHCSGWGKSWGRDLGEWEVDDDADAVTREDGAS